MGRVCSALLPGRRFTASGQQPRFLALQTRAHGFWRSKQVPQQQATVGWQQPEFTDVAEACSRVLDVQAGPIREVKSEGHSGGSADDGGSILLLQALVEDFHVQQAQEPEGSTALSIS